MAGFGISDAEPSDSVAIILEARTNEAMCPEFDITCCNINRDFHIRSITNVLYEGKFVSRKYILVKFEM
jgi:hypothetical protein